MKNETSRRVIAAILTWFFGGVCRHCGWWIAREEMVCARCADHEKRIRVAL
jgi:hypothetical protein